MKLIWDAGDAETTFGTQAYAYSSTRFELKLFAF